MSPNQVEHYLRYIDWTTSILICWDHAPEPWEFQAPPDVDMDFFSIAAGITEESGFYGLLSEEYIKYTVEQFQFEKDYEDYYEGANDAVDD